MDNLTDMDSVLDESDILAPVTKTQTDSMPDIRGITEPIVAQESDVVDNTKSKEDEARMLYKAANIFDSTGLPTESYYNWLATDPIAEQYGMTKPKPDSVLGVMSDAANSSWHSTVSGVAKSFGADETAARHDYILEHNRQWGLSDDQNILGYAAYHAVNAVVSSALPIAAGAGAAFATGGAGAIPAFATATAVIAQTFGDNLEKVQRDSAGLLNPYAQLGMAWGITSVNAGIETVLGPERFISLGLASKGARALTGAQLMGKSATTEAGRKSIEALGKAVFSGIKSPLKNAVNEGLEEVMQLAVHESAMNLAVGKEFSPFSEYKKSFAAGATGGFFLGMGGAMLGNIAEASAKAKVSSLADPVTEETISKIYREKDPILNQQAIANTRQAFDAFTMTLPESQRSLVPYIETMAHNLAAMSETSTKPEEMINTFKTVFLTDMSEAKAKELNGLIQGKSSAETIDILRKQVSGFDQLVRTTQDEVHLKMVRDINDSVERDQAKRYGVKSGETIGRTSGITEESKPEYDNFLSTVFGADVKAGIITPNARSMRLPFTRLQELGKAKSISKETIKALMVEGGLQDVEVDDGAGGKAKVDFKFNDDFSISITRSLGKKGAARAKAEAKTAEAFTVLEQAKKAKALAPKTASKLGVSGSEMDIASEAVRSVNLARKGRIQEEFDKRWEELLNGTDKPSTVKSLIDRLSDVLEARDKQARSTALVRARPSIKGMPSGYYEREAAIRTQIEEALKQLTQKLLPEQAEAANAKAISQITDIIKSIEDLDAGPRLLTGRTIRVPEEGAIAGYQLDTMAQSDDPAGKLLEEIDRNIEGGDLVKWRTDQINKIAMTAGISLKKEAAKIGDKLVNMSDREKANLIFQGLQSTESTLSGTRGTLNAVKSVFPKESPLNFQTDETTKGQYLASEKLAIFYKTADAETIVHEWIHHLNVNGFMPAQMRQTIFDNFAIDGQWTGASEENLVNAFMQWMTKAKLPDNASPELFKAFKSLKDTLASAYQKVVGGDEEVLNQAVDKTGDQEALNQKKAKPTPIEVLPETASMFESLLAPVDANTMEAIYGEALADSMENADGVVDPPMPEEEIDARVDAALNNKPLNQKVSDKRSSLWKQLHAQYKDHAKVMEVLGLAEGQGASDVTIMEMRAALRGSGFSKRQREWLLRSGISDESFRELGVRSPEGRYAAENKLADETRKREVKKLAEGTRVDRNARTAALSEDLAAEQLAAASWSNRVDTTETNEKATLALNSANRWQQRVIRWVDGLRDLSKFLGPAFDSQVWGRLKEPNNIIHYEKTKDGREYASKLNNNFAKETNRAYALPSGRKMLLNDMIALYAMSEGTTKSMKDLFPNGEMNPRYSDIVGWWGSNTGASLEVFNEAVDFINAHPDLEQIKSELDYITKKSNERFEKARKVYSAETGVDLHPNTKRWYTTLTRENGLIHEGDIDSIFEKFDGKMPDYKGIKHPREFNPRVGGVGGKVSLDYRANFMHHLNALTNYTHKASVIKDAYAIISNPSFQQAIRTRFGDDGTMMKTISELVMREMSPSGRWKKSEGVGDNTLGQLLPNVYNAISAANIGMVFSQLSGWTIATGEVADALGKHGVTPGHVAQMTKNTLEAIYEITKIKNLAAAWSGASLRDGLENWDTWQDMEKYGAPVANRLINPVVENISRANRQSLVAKNIPLLSGAIDLMFLPMAAGDMIIVTATWKTVFEAKKEQFRREHSEWDDETVLKRAGEEATEVVMSSQSPSVVGEKSLWQTGSGLEKAQIPFSGQAFTVFKSLMHDMVIPAIEAVKVADTKGEAVANVGKVIMNKRFASKVVMGILLPAIALGAIARRRPQNDLKELSMDMLFYGAGTIPVIGNAIWAGIALGWDRTTPGTFYQDMIGSVVKGTKMAMEGGTRKGFNEVARAAAMLTGTPLILTRAVDQAIDSFAKSDGRLTPEEFRRVIGWVEKKTNEG